MRVAVTGGTGFIGRYIMNHLISSGHSVRAWYRSAGDPATFNDAGVEWIPGELSSQESMAVLVQDCDAVVHAALWKPGAAFRGGEGDVLRFAKINILGSLRLIEAAIEADVPRFVYISSCAVHEVILDDRPLDEAHPLWATSHYGAHKAAVEKFVHSYGLGSGYKICALRPAGIYGVARPVERSKWFGLVQSVSRGEDVRVEGGGKEVHAADVARAVLQLLSADDTAGAAYNCCDQYISRHTVAVLAREISGSSSRIDGEPASPRHEIETGKLRGTGMVFGGEPLLRRTIEQLVDYATSSRAGDGK